MPFFPSSRSASPVTTSDISTTVALVVVVICGGNALHLSIRKPSSPGWTTTPAVHSEGRFPSRAPNDINAVPNNQRFANRLLSFAAFVLSLCIFATSLATVFLGGMSVGHVASACAWLVIALQTACLLRARSELRCFQIGQFLALANFAMALNSSLDLVISSGSADVTSKGGPIGMMLKALPAATSLFIALAASSLRPGEVVYHDGKPVDGQLISSALERYTFSWIRPLLSQARKDRRIEATDLPALDHLTRSQEVNAQFSEALQHSGLGLHRPLWKVILQTHLNVFAQQWILSIVESLAAMFPNYCLYRILSVIEAHPGNAPKSDIWLWIVLLAASKMIHVLLENWLYWTSFALLAIPIRAQLSAVVFEKALNVKATIGDPALLRKKPASSLPEGQEDASETDPLLSNKTTTDSKGGGTSKDSSSSEDGEVVRGVVNYLGIDVQRVSDFCGWNMDLVRGLAKILFGAVFLVSLVGWWSTLAGFAVPVIMQPLNRAASKLMYGKQVAVMQARDRKAHVVQEALHGIRQIKFSAAEKYWETRILEVREHELQATRAMYIGAIILTILWTSMPALLGAASLSVYALLSERMLASVAFTALAIFSSLEWVLGALPVTITEGLNATVSAVRLQGHLNTEERPVPRLSGDTVIFRNASIAWPAHEHTPEDFMLRNVDLDFPQNRLSVIHGKTGSGKSLFLNAIIGEADVVAGEFSLPEKPSTSSLPSLTPWIMPSSIAYVSQVPWIENASVKDAILFGLPYDLARFRQVIFACALIDDIRMLPDGHDTEIGATGINLSGGQRWRLTLARALYSRAGVLVMDDIFSAVDSHVGAHLLEHAILGPLGKGRTRILVTHHVRLVEQHASLLVRLDAGRVVEVSQKDVVETDSTSDASRAVNPSDDHTERLSNDTSNVPRKFVQDETRARGRVSWSVYRGYILASGGLWFWITTALVFTVTAFVGVSRSYWLAVWTNSYTTAALTISSTSGGTASTVLPSSVGFYLSIYLGISALSISLLGVRVVFIIIAVLRAARTLFEDVTHNVLRAPLRWLDSEPTGRILNRFVGDFEKVDTRVGGNIHWTLSGVLGLLFILVSSVYVSFWTAIPVIALFGLNVFVLYLYLDAARDVKRLESVAVSPIHELVGSAVAGLTTIRSFAKTSDYLERMFTRIDRYSQASWYVRLATQWMATRLGLLGVLFTTSIALVVGWLPAIDASLAGFALSLALNFSFVAEEAISHYSSMELDMNSTERVIEYTNMPTETTAGTEPFPSWPPAGHIAFRELEVGYAPDLPAVLKSISFSIPPGSRVGIVGRTGSGKSSLTLALFRFLSPRHGAILVDDIDIRTLPLSILRSRLAIIPQDPVLFSGTLRSNLDPAGTFSDAELLTALDRVDFPLPSASLAPLTHPIARGGANLSQGEKQLLCLARAMLLSPRILILDEATSAVDMHTDARIQDGIRRFFPNTTLLCVAHRLSSVVDFDRILVLDEGRVAEYDAPGVLVRKEGGAFRKMVEDSGERVRLRRLLGLEGGGSGDLGVSTPE